jgi:electron transfer flavoprotein-quinone oxidoreductase
MAEAVGAREGFALHTMGVGVKHLYQLDEELINNRFHCKSGEGVAYGILGSATAGLPGGGFLYTNKDTVSVGVVLHIGHLVEKGVLPSVIWEVMVENPEIAALLDGAALIEYGAHMVSEGGLENLPKRLYGNGWVIVGDAAGFAANNGFTVRGMDMAAASGLLAAEAVLEARAANDYSEARLSAYKKKLEASFVYKDMKTYEKAPLVMGYSELYNEIPGFVCNIFGSLYLQDSSPKSNLMATARTSLKGSGLKLGRLASLGLKAVRSL